MPDLERTPPEPRAVTPQTFMVDGEIGLSAGVVRFDCPHSEHSHESVGAVQFDFSGWWRDHPDTTTPLTVLVAAAELGQLIDALPALRAAALDAEREARG